MVRFSGKIVLNIVSVVLIACSLGIYQAYFANTTSLLVMNMILLCAFSGEDKKWKDILFTADPLCHRSGGRHDLYFVLH